MVQQQKGLKNMRVLKIRTLEDWEMQIISSIEVLEAIQVEKELRKEGVFDLEQKIKAKYEILKGIRKSLIYERTRHELNIPDEEKVNLAELND